MTDLKLKIAPLLLALLLISAVKVQARLIPVGNVTELTSAIDNAKPGDTIYVKDGKYPFTSRVTIRNSGTASDKIYLTAHPENTERPLFDFSAMPEKSSNQGFRLKANYWHLQGIDFFNAGDNGLLIENGHHNIIEFCTFSECSDTGLQLDSGSSHNTILNCDSFYNADESMENADGFACKMDVGTGNKFIGCRAWQNLDDGWDGYLRGTDSVSTTFENCWAFKNGLSKDGTPSGGDGNGFKTGGSDEKTLKHNVMYTRCVAAGNTAEGFDHNSNRGVVVLYNCSAHKNETNLGFGSKNALSKLIIKNTLTLGEPEKINADFINASHNSWQIAGVKATEADFVSLDIDQLAAPRKADGSLPDIAYLQLKKESDLINKGVDVGIPFNGPAPDLGAFEFGQPIKTLGSR